LIESPARPDSVGDPVSDALRRIRITGSMQYCFMPSGDWETDATPAAYKPSDAIGFHIVAAGPCWVELDGERTILEEGDIAAFPFGAPHMLGAGMGGRLIDPGNDLPPAPWRDTPVLRYDDAGRQVRILCGYVRCEAMDFRPFKEMLPKFIHVRTQEGGAADWLAATIRQIIVEVDAPQRGGSSVLERLTEVTFIEVLRRQFLRADTPAQGWLAAVRDPALARCLGAIHANPYEDWSVAALAHLAALSRSALADRFMSTLHISPMRYVRDWRLYLASVQLKLMDKPVAAVAYDAGYATEAAFNRAFSRAYGKPPATWRSASPR